MKYFKLILIGIVFSLGFVSALTPYQDCNVYGNCVPISQSVSGGGNSTFNQSLSDLLYWRLDGTNAPPTADWNMGGKGFGNIGSSNFSTNKILTFRKSGAIFNTGFQIINESNDVTTSWLAAGQGNGYSMLVDLSNRAATITMGDTILGGQSTLSTGSSSNLEKGFFTIKNSSADTLLRINTSNGLSTFVYNLTAPNICYSDGTNCTASGGNPFNQVLNTSSNVTFNNITLTGNSLFQKNVSASWFKGLFNWTVLNNWLTFDGATLSFNESRLNETINQTITQSGHEQTICLSGGGTGTQYLNFGIASEGMTGMRPIKNGSILGISGVGKSGVIVAGQEPNYTWMLNVSTTNVFQNALISTPTSTYYSITNLTNRGLFNFTNRDNITVMRRQDGLNNANIQMVSYCINFIYD